MGLAGSEQDQGQQDMVKGKKARKQKRIRSKGMKEGKCKEREQAKTAPWHQGTEGEWEKKREEHTSL